MIVILQKGDRGINRTARKIYSLVQKQSISTDSATLSEEKEKEKSIAKVFSQFQAFVKDKYDRNKNEFVQFTIESNKLEQTVSANIIKTEEFGSTSQIFAILLCDTSDNNPLKLMEKVSYDEIILANVDGINGFSSMSAVNIGDNTSREKWLHSLSNLLTPKDV